MPDLVSSRRASWIRSPPLIGGRLCTRTPEEGDADAFVELKQVRHVDSSRAPSGLHQCPEGVSPASATRNAMTKNRARSVQPISDFASPPTRHPRWHDLPTPVWAGMAAVLAVSLTRLGCI
jgi:hypothetical protein